jgi:hypothetical protein
MILSASRVALGSSGKNTCPFLKDYSDKDDVRIPEPGCRGWDYASGRRNWFASGHWSSHHLAMHYGGAKDTKLGDRKHTDIIDFSGGHPQPAEQIAGGAATMQGSPAMLVIES